MARIAVEGTGEVRLYDAETGRPALALKALGNPPLMEFSPDSARIAVLSRSECRVYDVRTGEQICLLNVPDEPGSLWFSPDGARILMGSRSGNASRLYDARTGTQIGQITASVQLGQPWFSPDGTRITVPCGDGSVRLYDSQTSQEVIALAARAPGGNTPLIPDHTALMSPDGARLAAVGSSGGSVRLWPAPKDVAEWQGERRADLAHALPAWHQLRGREAENAGDWYAAAFHLRQLFEAEPASARDHYRCGLALAHLGRKAEAAKELQAALDRKADLYDREQAEAYAILEQWDAAARVYAAIVTPRIAFWETGLRYALVCLARDDRAGYAATCSALLEQHGKSDNPRAAMTAAWGCALVPQALPDLGPAVQAARRAAEARPKEWGMHTVLGATLFRVGQQEEAVRELKQSIELDPAGGWPMGFLLLAMAHHRLGKPAEARDWLEKATQAHARQPAVFWTERLEWQLLHCEAEALLKESGAEPKK
jgi:tetratricopeptide (TPR) repeat protein